MKRRELLQHLLANGCEVHREGGNHTVLVHRGNRKSSTLPRHSEINEVLARKICKDLGVPRPGA